MKEKYDNLHLAGGLDASASPPAFLYRPVCWAFHLCRRVDRHALCGHAATGKLGLCAGAARQLGRRAASASRTDFRGAELVGTILKGAVAIRAKFSRAVVRRHNYPDLDQKPDFSNASFIACDFQHARLEEVIFLGANFSRADFSGATLVKCDFTGADLSESKWKKVRRVENCTWKKVKGISHDNFPLELLKEIEKQNAKRG